MFFFLFRGIEIIWFNLTINKIVTCNRDLWKKNFSVAVAQLEDAILDVFQADVKTTEKFKI